MKNILVIGSKGFIGKTCVRHFQQECSVTGCDIFPNETGSSYFCISAPGDFEKIISSSDFDVCINASGSAHVGFSFQFPERDYELNVTNVKLILEAVRSKNPACKVINFSSAAVYGNPSALPISENAATAPLSPYGKHKLEAEKLMHEYAENKKLLTCSLRVFSSYGPGLHKQLFWDIFQKSRLSKTISLYGTGKESRDFIFSGDLVKAIGHVIDKAVFKGEVYNVASGEETTIREAAELFLSFLSGKYELEFSGEEKSGDPLNWKADISRLATFGFRPSTTLSQGLHATVENYLSGN